VTSAQYCMQLHHQLRLLLPTVWFKDWSPIPWIIERPFSTRTWHCRPCKAMAMTTLLNAMCLYGVRSALHALIYSDAVASGNCHHRTLRGKAARCQNSRGVRRTVNTSFTSRNHHAGILSLYQALDTNMAAGVCTVSFIEGIGAPRCLPPLFH
jgi:hypothetical protein